MKRPLPLSLLVLSLIAGGITSSSQASPSNLLENPSFETDSTLPTLGWTLSIPNERNREISPAEASIIEDAQQAHSGQRFLRLTPQGQQILVHSDRHLHMEPGIYEVSLWVKGTPGTSGPFGINALNANLGTGIQIGKNPWQGNGRWRNFSMKVWSDGYDGFPWPDQTSLLVGVNKGKQENTTLDIDDLRVAKIEAGLSELFSHHMVLQRDRPLPFWGWARDAGQQVTVEFNGQTKTATADAEGRWQVTLDPMPVGGPYVIKLDGEPVAYDVMLGDVWICAGQSNMDFGLNLMNGQFQKAPEALAEADIPMIRLWTAPKQFSPTPMKTYQLRQHSPNQPFQAIWNVCSPASASWGIWGGFSAVGFYFGRDIQAKENIPVGLIMIANGGTQIESFLSPESLAKVPQEQWVIPPINEETVAALQNDPFPELPEGIDAPTTAYAEAIPRRLKETPKIDKKSFNLAGGIYNGMVAPLTPFPVKGVIWYQGEHNGNDPHYALKLKTLIEQWRTAQGNPTMPFIIAQLCNWRPPKPSADPYGWARAREAQLQVAQSDPHVGLAVTLDLADKEGDGYGRGEIHPKNKKDVGLRMALEARAIAYGEKLVSSGPLYREMKVDGPQILLSFDSIGSGLIAKDGESLHGFTIAGEDRIFTPAQATIEGNNIVVRSDQVPRPKAVRYAFGQTIAKFNLYNKEGLPASPFRTDQWEPSAPEPK